MVDVDGSHLCTIGDMEGNAVPGPGCRGGCWRLMNSNAVDHHDWVGGWMSPLTDSAGGRRRTGRCLLITVCGRIKDHAMA